jgi:hypothetical protein
MGDDRPQALEAVFLSLEVEAKILRTEQVKFMFKQELEHSVAGP